MSQKVMLEATQSVVAGNEVVVHAGELFDPGADLPEGVTVRPVLVDASSSAPSDEVAKEEAARPGVAEADQPRRGGAAKPPGK